MPRKTNYSGFSTFELLIITAIVGVLAALVAITFGGVSERSRDSQRKKDLDALSSKLEAYQAQTNNYPSLAQLNNPDFRKVSLPGLDAGLLQDPKSSSQKLVAVPQTHVYAYEPTPTGCDNVNSSCTAYSLIATLETGGIYTKTSP